jgi:hypothetical protein
MIVYITSMTRTMNSLVKHAKGVVLEMGSGTAKMVVPEPYLTQNDELSFADSLVQEHSKGGIVVVPSTYELVLLRLMKRVSDKVLAPNDLLVHNFYMNKAEGRVFVKRMELTMASGDAEFTERFPEGFFDLRAHELF